MTTDPVIAPAISVQVREAAVQAVLRVPGVEAIHPPSHGLWKELTGSPLAGYESLRIRTRGPAVMAELEIGIAENGVAVEIAAAIQKCLFETLAAHVPSPASLSITVIVL